VHISLQQAITTATKSFQAPQQNHNKKSTKAPHD